MLVEPPRATSAARRAPPAVLKRPAWPAPARAAALIAAVVLTVTGRGDLWTLALLVGVADRSMLTALVVAAAGAATLARTGSAALVDINGAQAVLGAAGFTGSLAAVTATWTSAVALVAVARDRWTSAVLGLIGGTLVAGTALNGGMRSVVVWIAGVVAGASVGWFVRPAAERKRWQVGVDIGMATAAVAFGVLAGYH